jgi:peptide/nickel transport system permease protein
MKGEAVVKFFIRSLLTTIPLLIGVSICVFLMIQLVPGDPVLMMLGENSFASKQNIESIRQEMGFNDPLPVQYGRYLTKLIHGDLGVSMRSKRAVAQEISLRLKSTFQLTFAGLGFAIVIGVALGILAALNHNTIIDNICSVTALIGVSVPSFWLGLLLIFFFAIYLGWFPVTSAPNSGIKGLILPALTLGLYAQGSIARLVRSGMLEVMMQDYIRTARAKGMRESMVVLRHAFRNVLIPVITIIGVQFGGILAGTTIIETVFARAGLGLLLVSSIIAKDFPMVQGIVMFVAAAYIIINMIIENTYALIDPRIRVS